MSAPRLMAPALVLAAALLSCSDDENTVVPPALITHYDQTHDWTCAQGVSCQDVYNISFTAGTVADIALVGLTDDTIAQIALYAPGVPLGGTNLFTGTNSEYRSDCTPGCATMPNQSVEDFVLPMGGTYRLAVTRDSADSCGETGTYRLIISTDNRFEFPVRTANDVASLAAGVDCP